MNGATSHAVVVSVIDISSTNYKSDILSLKKNYLPISLIGGERGSTD
jgi:hypothetical protein